jgi:hypothetical protein
VEDLEVQMPGELVGEVWGVLVGVIHGGGVYQLIILTVKSKLTRAPACCLRMSPDQTSEVGASVAHLFGAPCSRAT